MYCIIYIIESIFESKSYQQHHNHGFCVASKQINKNGTYHVMSNSTIRCIKSFLRICCTASLGCSLGLVCSRTPLGASALERILNAHGGTTRRDDKQLQFPNKKGVLFSP